MDEENSNTGEPGLADLAKLREAAGKGDAHSQGRLGTILLRANVESDVLEGLDWLEQAALKQDPVGMYALAGLLLINPGVDDLNRRIALMLLERLGIWGKTEVDIASNMGELFFGEVALGFGYLLIKPNSTGGLAVLNAALAAGSTVAMCLLAEFYLAEQHGRMGRTKALELFTQAAELGDLQAQERLATFYKRGENVEPNPTLAAQWSVKAAFTRKHQKPIFKKPGA